jgi:uncharacterized membrane protein
MSPYVFAFLIGVIAGLRSMTAPAVVSWAARLGWLHLEGTPLAFLGSPITSYILTALALGELVADKLPTTPSRKTLAPFMGRIGTGALSGAAIGAASGGLLGGLIAGALGGAFGTLGGYEFRSRLVKAIGGKDLPVAILEDVIAIAGGIWITA